MIYDIPIQFTFLGLILNNGGLFGCWVGKTFLVKFLPNILLRLLRNFPLDDLENLEDLSSRDSWETFLLRIFPLDNFDHLKDLEDLEDLVDLSSGGCWETFLFRLLRNFSLDDLEDLEDVSSWGSWETFLLRIFPPDDLEDLQYTGHQGCKKIA